MRLIYFAATRMPTEKARGIQIVKMCEAFTLVNANITNKEKNDANKLKLEVELLVPWRFNSIKGDVFQYYGVERNFKVKKLPCLDLVPLDRYLGNFAAWVKNITFSFSVFFYLLFNKPDIIYTRDKFSLYFSLFFKKNFFFEAHTFPKNYFLYSPFFKRLKKIIVITQKLKNLFIEKGIPENKILVAPDGVDIEKFDVRCSKLEAREKLGLPKDKKIVLYTGHLYRWKGVYTLAEASQYLLEDVEIYFVGGTQKDIENFKNRTSNLKLNIIGHRLHKEIPYWLKAVDVLVLPNSAEADISKFWTSPVKMFEYMASKRPIVASNISSIREILNEKNALFFEPDNSKDLAKAIEKIFQNSELFDGISNQAYIDVQNYTWEKRAKRILDFIINFK